MTSALNLSLPEAPRPRPRAGMLQWLTFLAVAVVLALLLVKQNDTPADRTAGAPEEIERLKTLATDLERRTLYPQAERAWAEYMAVASLTPLEIARTLYRRGKCLKEGGQYAEAARWLMEVEASPVPREEKRKSRRLLLECLAALGKQDVRDTVARSFATREEEKGTVLARVGSDAITREELRAEITGSLEQALKLQGAPLTPAELTLKAREVAETQLSQPESAREALLQAISARVLYRKGLERGFADDTTTLKAISRFRRNFIAHRVVESELEVAMKNPGATDLANHYAANKERFIEKQSAEFSYATFPDRTTAQTALERLRADSSAQAEELQKASGAAVAGQPVPEIGVSAEISVHLLTLGEGELSDRPIEQSGSFYIFRVEKKRPERQLSLEEAESLVKADLSTLKRKEAIGSLQAQLSQEFHVEILDENLPEGGAPDPQAPTAPATPLNTKQNPEQ